MIMDLWKTTAVRYEERPINRQLNNCNLGVICLCHVDVCMAPSYCHGHSHKYILFYRQTQSKTSNDTQMLKMCTIWILIQELFRGIFWRENKWVSDIQHWLKNVIVGKAYISWCKPTTSSRRHTINPHFCPSPDLGKNLISSTANIALSTIGPFTHTQSLHDSHHHLGNHDQQSPWHQEQQRPIRDPMYA
jgi:hypothetical protein